jgi:hypothetical protein
MPRAPVRLAAPWPCYGRAPSAARPGPRPRAPLPEPVPRRPRAPRACTVRVPSARAACSRAATVATLRLTLVLIHFNFSLVDVLRRALRRTKVRSKFVCIKVLRRALRRATILLIYIY